MIAPTYPWQQVQSTQPVAPVATPFFPPAPQAVPPQPVPQYSPSVLLHEAEDIVKTLQPAHFALLHGVAVVMLLHPGTGYRPTPNETQNAHLLTQGQLLTLVNGGYVLTILGHAVLSVAEANAIR